MATARQARSYDQTIQLDRKFLINGQSERGRSNEIGIDNAQIPVFKTTRIGRQIRPKKALLADTSPKLRSSQNGEKFPLKSQTVLLATTQLLPRDEADLKTNQSGLIAKKLYKEIE
uniref:Uncharacterized protein n=1 Tax=Magallana gigas TaxID=29159 RepID=K1QMH3_MAGGI